MEPGCNHKLMGFIRKRETDRSPHGNAQARGLHALYCARNRTRVRELAKINL
jgi:hypothetical protein